MNSPLQTWKYWAFKQFGVSELYNVNLRWTPRHSWAYQRALSKKVPRCWMIYFNHISVLKVASWVSWKGCGQKNRRVQIFRVLVVLTRTLHQKMIGQETRLRCFLILNHLGLEHSNECTWLFVVVFCWIKSITSRASIYNFLFQQKCHTMNVKWESSYLIAPRWVKLCGSQKVRGLNLPNPPQLRT